MTENKLIKPDYIFETSWEICNMVGGIYTVVSTKANLLVKEYKDNFILIGPDVWMETRKNPDFIEDKYLYKSWREKAESEGLKIRIGRWNIAGEPLVILVDFTPYFQNKDNIFTEFWKIYKLDSLSGQWDYAEPALFGYAAAKTIESFYNFNLSAQDKIVAQFHEWMTGTGLLYLKEKVPQIGCVFTTHATVLGRCIAGNNLPLYNNLTQYNSEMMAANFGVKSKYSLEKLSARESDAFTTVSEITALECSYFFDKKVDIITPNGFDDSFVPDNDSFGSIRKTARDKLINVAEALLNQQLPGDSILMVNSGRYEFKNKGIDLFIDSLAKLEENDQFEQTVVAFIMVPANQSGARKEVIDRMNHPDFSNPITGEYLTHGLHDAEFDPILKRIKKNNIFNRPDQKVKIIFVPSYLNGDDGIFNLDYYNLLPGFDISVFPSYYEPWGYTPLESLAFHIPTITTSLAGFGRWVKNNFPDIEKGVCVVERTDDNDDEVINKIAFCLKKFIDKTEGEKLECHQWAYKISRVALWKNLINHYFDAFSLALQKVEQRHDLFKDKTPYDHFIPLRKIKYGKPEWKKVFISSVLPPKISSLQKLARNLWWSWNTEAIELFSMIDPELWTKFGHNPIAMLESLNYKQLRHLERNEKFVQKLESVTQKFDAYMSVEKPKDMIAYFSMEYGLHDSLKIYSGGLGVLAGDYLKEASDSNENIVGIGLMYRYGYFTQALSIFGDQLVNYEPQKFSFLPLAPVRNAQGKWITISVALPGRTVFAKVWRVDVGRIPLYLLDTDIDENSENDRTITHNLYGGDWENRLKQELLLGVGGIRMLDAMGITPTIYHCNEGHAAFTTIERIRKYVEDSKFSFNQAIEIIRSSSLFTTHTPVPAGHDSFSEDLLRMYIPHYANRLNITWDEFMNLGRIHENDPNEKFSMSVLAAKLSQEINGVSRIHGRVTREMFADLYEGFFPEELHIGYVTNGVHYPTWTAPEWQRLYNEHLSPDFESVQSNKELWSKIQNVPDKTIWDIRLKLKKDLINYIKTRLNDDMTRRQDSPQMIFKTLESIDEKALTVGFARRFATYKRAHLLFTNLERLSLIVNHPKHPVHFIFAGKAHPSDKAGEEFIKKIIEISKRPEFLGKITFIENYEMDLAKKLVQGVDVWLNTPTRPLEASGTSGEKAVMNGVLNFSVLDGWWAEGYCHEAGWMLKEARTYANQQFQDELDAETLYNTFEEDIVPLFYRHDPEGLPHDWIKYIKNSIAKIAPHFTMKRMLTDYQEKYYSKLILRSKMMTYNDCEVARRLATWKRRILRSWDSIEVVSMILPHSTIKPLVLGESYKAEIILDLNELSATDIGVEVILGQKENDEVKEIVYKEEMKITKTAKNQVSFRCEIPAVRSGVFDYAFRVFPKNPLLPHRQDFNLVKWI